MYQCAPNDVWSLGVILVKTQGVVDFQGVIYLLALLDYAHERPSTQQEIIFTMQ